MVHVRVFEFIVEFVVCTWVGVNILPLGTTIALCRIRFNFICGIKLSLQDLMKPSNIAIICCIIMAYIVGP